MNYETELKKAARALADLRKIAKRSLCSLDEDKAIAVLDSLKDTYVVGLGRGIGAEIFYTEYEKAGGYND